MSDTRNVKINQPIPVLGKLIENAKSLVFCSAVRWIFYIFCFMMFSIAKAHLSSSAVTVNYILEFRGMKLLCQRTQRFLSYFCLVFGFEISFFSVHGHFCLVSISGLVSFRQKSFSITLKLSFVYIFPAQKHFAEWEIIIY